MFKIENLFSRSVDSILLSFEKTIQQLKKRQEVVSELSRLDREVIDNANARLVRQDLEFKRAEKVIERIQSLIQ